MIRLYRDAGAWGLPSVSPFGLKLETWLRMADLPYEIREANPLRAPTGKIPYIELNGEHIGDSQLIIERLTRQFEVLLDEGMSPGDRATARLVRRTLEEATYFNLVTDRWLTDDGYAMVFKAFTPFFPPLVRNLAIPAVRRTVRNQAYAQGAGRHAPETSVAMAIEDWEAIALVMGDRPYLLGDVPRSVDATVYAFLAQILVPPRESAMKRALESKPALAAYHQRMHDRYFPQATLLPEP